MTMSTFRPRVWNPGSGRSQQGSGLPLEQVSFEKSRNRPPHPRRPTEPPPPSSPPPPVETFSFAMTPGYPRVWYHGIYTHGNGHSLLTNNGETLQSVLDSPIDEGMATALSRYPLITLSDGPFMDKRQDVATYIKSKNPQCHVLWSMNVMLRFDWIVPTMLWNDEFNIFKGPPDMRLRCTDGSLFPFAIPPGVAYFIDIGQIKERMFQALVDHGAGSGVAEGFWLDFANGVISGGAEPSFPDGTPRFLDPTSTGWANLSQLNASAKAGLDYYVDHLKQFGPVWGNGTVDADSLSRWYGRVRETLDPDFGFIGGSNPPSGFATFDDFVADMLLYTGPGIDGGGTQLVKGDDASTTYTQTWMKLARFSPGTAALAGAYGCVAPEQTQTQKIQHPELWADEWSVNTDGTHDPTGARIGWLGRPVDPPGFKDPVSHVWVRRFQNGIVLVNGDGPNGLGGKTITLERAYKRIQGVHDTVVNNGAIQQTVTVPNKDAVFMVRI